MQRKIIFEIGKSINLGRCSVRLDASLQNLKGLLLGLSKNVLIVYEERVAVTKISEASSG